MSNVVFKAVEPHGRDRGTGVCVCDGNGFFLGVAGARGRWERLWVALWDCPTHTQLVGTCSLTPQPRLGLGTVIGKKIIKDSARQEGLFFCHIAITWARHSRDSSRYKGVLFWGRRNTEFLGFQLWTPQSLSLRGPPWTFLGERVKPTPLWSHRCLGRLCSACCQQLWKVKVGQRFNEKINWKTFLLHFIKLHFS